MTSEFEDTYTVAIPANSLHRFVPGDCFSSPRRPVPLCNNLYWWVQYHPDGATQHNKQNVSVYIFTSAGGFELIQTVTVLRSNVKHEKTIEKKDWSENCVNGWPKVISHDEIRLGDTIVDGFLMIKCDVKFSIPKETIDVLQKFVLCKDSYTIKFNRKMLDSNQSVTKIVGEKQTSGGIKWWIEYNLHDRFNGDEKYVSLYFNAMESPVRMQYSCAISFGSFHIQKSHHHNFENTGSSGFGRCFSHKILKLADHKAGVIDIVCEVRFFRPHEPQFAQLVEQNASIETMATVANTSLPNNVAINYLTHTMHPISMVPVTSNPGGTLAPAPQHVFNGPVGSLTVVYYVNSNNTIDNSIHNIDSSDHSIHDSSDHSVHDSRDHSIHDSRDYSIHDSSNHSSNIRTYH